MQANLNGLHILLKSIYKVSFTLSPTTHPLPVAIQRDGHFCQPITCGSLGICLQGTDWPHKRSFAVSSLNIAWHVAPAPREYNSTWLASSAGRHDSGLSSTVHHCGPGAREEEHVILVQLTPVTNIKEKPINMIFGWKTPPCQHILVGNHSWNFHSLIVLSGHFLSRSLTQFPL